MKGHRAALGTSGLAVRLSAAERLQAEADGAEHLARFASGTRHLQRIWVAVTVPVFVANLVWGVTVTQMPALG